MGCVKAAHFSLSKKYVMPAKRALKSVFCHGSAGAKNTSIRTSVQATPRCARLTQCDAALTQRDGLRLTRPCAQCGCSCRKSRKTFSTDSKGSLRPPYIDCYAQIYSLRCVIRLPIWGLENCASAPTLSPFLRICSFMSDENSSTGIL